jgi:hypothetical protein
LLALAYLDSLSVLPRYSLPGCALEYGLKKIHLVQQQDLVLAGLNFLVTLSDSNIIIIITISSSSSSSSNNA